MEFTHETLTKEPCMAWINKTNVIGISGLDHMSWDPNYTTFDLWSHVVWLDPNSCGLPSHTNHSFGLLLYLHSKATQSCNCIINSVVCIIVNNSRKIVYFEINLAWFTNEWAISEGNIKSSWLCHLNHQVKLLKVYKSFAKHILNRTRNHILF